MIRPYKVESLTQFIEKVCHVRAEWCRKDKLVFDPWFRGIRDSAWGLAPSLYRLDLAHDEAFIRLEFKRRAAQLMTEREPPSEWGWYFLMQHYGAPTRLLDWTDGALIALFFALLPVKIGVPDVTSDAAVWMLDPAWLNREALKFDNILSVNSPEASQYLTAFDETLDKELPIAIDPPHIARRLGVQHSRFTVHGKAKDGLEKVGARNGGRLTKIVILQSAVEKMRLDLVTCGIVDTTVFPDLEGLSRELIRSRTEIS